MLSSVESAKHRIDFEYELAKMRVVYRRRHVPFEDSRSSEASGSRLTSPFQPPHLRVLFVELTSLPQDSASGETWELTINILCDPGVEYILHCNSFQRRVSIFFRRWQIDVARYHVEMFFPQVIRLVV